MKPAPLVPLLAAAALLLSATGVVAGDGPLGLATADAGKRCQGAHESPKRLTVAHAQRLVVCLVNKRRASHGLRRLKRNDRVAKAAAKHTRRMRDGNCFAHTCSGEPDLSGRLAQADYLPCGCSWSAGENIAWGKGKKHGSPAKVVKAWMRSPGHRSVLLSKKFEHVGVGFRRGGPYAETRKLGTYTLDVGYKH